MRFCKELWGLCADLATILRIVQNHGEEKDLHKHGKTVLGHYNPYQTLKELKHSYKDLCRDLCKIQGPAGCFPGRPS